MSKEFTSNPFREFAKVIQLGQLFDAKVNNGANVKNTVVNSDIYEVKTKNPKDEIFYEFDIQVKLKVGKEIENISLRVVSTDLNILNSKLDIFQYGIIDEINIDENEYTFTMIVGKEVEKIIGLINI